MTIRKWLEKRKDPSFLKMAAHSPPVATLQPAEGEVTLVDKASSSRADGVLRKRSMDEINSLQSFRTGSSNKSNKSAKSDVDRLIDAISGPLSVGEPEPEERSLQRSNSKESGHSRKSAGSLGNISSSRTSVPHGRSGRLTRSKSYGAPEHLRSPVEGPAGSEFVTDNMTMLKAVRMPDEFAEDTKPEETPSHIASKVLFDLPDKEDSTESTKPREQDAENLQILVAEDDPVNSRIIKKRLEKSGHEIYHTVNGEECASAYGEKPAFFDVVLMDMQMPIVDGLTSTKMIRSFEKSHPQSILSPRAASNGRVPIFAVSASLVERERQTYVNAGFDGWILKPIDFKRVNILLAGIVDDESRNACLYEAGEWERGGWFHPKQPSVFLATTNPSDESPVQNPPPRGRQSLQPDIDSLHSSESGSITPTVTPSNGPRKPLIHDERLNAMKEVDGEGDLAATEDRPVEDVTGQPEA